jgi:hypothetical protein
MTDAANFTCDYYIYDATGTQVGKAKKVAVEEFILPVYSIGMSCKNITGALLLDDYRLYASRVSTDFYLYHADTGMSITETEKAQDGNVAYRLSWLNATNTEKSYTVMAAYYNGDTLVSEEAVKDIKMAANFDGIITGVVDKKDGQTLKVYLKDNNPPEEDEPAAPGTDTPVPETTPAPTGEQDPAGDNTKLIIIIAAAAAVIVIAVVIVIVASKKKKKTAEPTADNTETPKED